MNPILISFSHESYNNLHANPDWNHYPSGHADGKFCICWDWTSFFYKFVRTAQRLYPVSNRPTFNILSILIKYQRSISFNHFWMNSYLQSSRVSLSPFSVSLPKSFVKLCKLTWEESCKGRSLVSSGGVTMASWSLCLW